ncbi:MAG: hypothetical protein ACRD2T_00055, partial [Thermoanaerobaculia bacterium]
MKQLAVHSMRLTLSVLAFVPPLAAQFEITVLPPVANLDSELLLRLTNRGPEPYPFPCCAAPVVAPAGEEGGPEYECSDCPAQCGLSGEEGVLPAGGTIEHRWRPLESGCFGLARSPGVYDVRWRGFPPGTVGRVELLPDPRHTLPVGAGRAEARAGETVALRLENTSSLSLV